MSWTVWIVVLGVYAVASVVTFVAYGVDKRRAGRGGWRISERTLHGLELIGGWPGALAGQAVFRHKRRKAGFMVVFAGIALGHLAGWAVYFAMWR
jgi:uncharacterized membrane protein YsdA (DUF1294 family)